MKKEIFLLSAALSLLFVSCDQSGSGILFDGMDASKWSTSGQVSVKEMAMTLSGEDAKVILSKGNYDNFEISLELKTSEGGKGSLWFHTDPALDKGYQVAINNDLQSPEWWKMSGSLLSVRNLTKSFVKENEWFTMSVKVYGRYVAVEINGEPVVEYLEPANPYRETPNKEAILSSGTFALTSTGKGDIVCRKIAVRSFGETSDLTNEEQLAEAIDENEDEIIKLHQANFPVLDYHVHLKGGLTKEQAAKQSRKLGVNYAVAPNCGIGFPVTNDEEIYAYIDTMRTQPFILAMQAEGREWLTTFSQEARDQFDYVFTDALTFTDKKERRTRLWIKEETWIENEQEYMDLIVDKICDVLKEPVDIYVNPCYLPDQMSDRYDEFWTEARIDKFVDALAKSGKALEINELYQIPNKAILMKAKDAGVKFTFGSNNVTPDVSDLSYSLRMMKECGLTAGDMYRPRVKL